MEYPFDDMIEFDKLGLYYEAHMAGLDGECFYYSVYFENSLNAEKLDEIDKAIYEFRNPYDDKEIYLGYLDITKVDDDKIFIYLDLGNVNPQYENISINGILQSLNNVSDIKLVIINEDCECNIPDEYNY